MQAAPNLKHHPVGGKASHGNRRVLTEKAQVGRFSEQLKIDEADMFGDNFQKLKDTPQDFGRAAGRLRPDLVAALLMSNPTLTQTARALFNSTDGNAATGKALARATLSEMIARLLKVKDGDATLNLKMTHLVVPPDLIGSRMDWFTQSPSKRSPVRTPRTTAFPRTDARSRSTTFRVLAEFLWSVPRP
jgi:hypothetical protein